MNPEVPVRGNSILNPMNEESDLFGGKYFMKGGGREFLD